MNNTKKLSLVALSISTIFLGGCGDAETTIIEREPIVETPPTDGGDSGSNPPSNDFLIESIERYQ